MWPATGSARCTENFTRAPELAIEDRSRSLKIVNDAAGAVRLENLFDEFDVLRVCLVIVLRFFAVEGDIQRDLVALLDHRPLARHHSANVKMNDAWLDTEIFFRAGDECIGSFRVFGFRPKNDDV
jgi:hypothetical protein